MMSIRTADNLWEHLYPEFREKLKAVVAEISHETGQPWVMSEGYRSVERQLWLYAQGRTRPGRVVTWKRSPTWHGTGLAADMLPERDGYNAPHSMWETYRVTYERHGLLNPAWGNGDLGHVQLTDYAVRAKSLLWVRNGFPSIEVPHPEPAIRIMVGTELVADAEAEMRDNRIWVRLRPVCDHLDLVILQVQASDALLGDAETEKNWTVPVEMKDGHAFVKVGVLPGTKIWHAPSKTVTLRR